MHDQPQNPVFEKLQIIVATEKKPNVTIDAAANKIAR